MHRIIFTITEQDHRRIKVCAAQLGISIKNFATECILEKTKYYENLNDHIHEKNRNLDDGKQ